MLSAPPEPPLLATRSTPRLNTPISVTSPIQRARPSVTDLDSWAGWRPSLASSRPIARFPNPRIFEHVIGRAPDQTEDEKEFIVAMQRSWEDARAEGRTEERVDALLTLLRVRGIAVPDAARERILAQKDLDQLRHWFEKAAVASTIGEVIDDPN